MGYEASTTHPYRNNIAGQAKTAIAELVAAFRWTRFQLSPHTPLVRAALADTPGEHRTGVPQHD